MSSPNRLKCPEPGCKESFGSPSELRLHARGHAAIAEMTKPHNGHAVRTGVAPARTEALEMLDEGWPTPALRFVIRKFSIRDEPCPECGTLEFLSVGNTDGSKTCRGGHKFMPTIREARILQQLWQFGDESKPVSRWQDVPTFEGEG